MNEPNGTVADKLVEIHKAKDPWEGHLVIGFLRENGVEGAYQGLASVALDAHEMMGDTDRTVGVFVLERDVPRARELIKAFTQNTTDTASIEWASVVPSRPDKERIAELRNAVREERRTFDFLRWTGVVFLAALAVLWMVWPEWLQTTAPGPLYRYTGAGLLALASIFASNALNHRPK